MAFDKEDKRIFPRIKFNNPLRFQVRGKPEANNGITDNISLGGMSFISNKFIPSLTTVMLEFNVLSRMLLPIGRIAWASPIPQSDRYRLGIEFLEMEPKEKRFLSDYLEMQTNSYGG